MRIAPEHLATGVLRSLLGSALQPTASSLLGPRIVFATPTGERHELGLLIAALTTLGAGANPLYLGLPVEGSNAAVLAMSVVTVPPVQVNWTLVALRGGLAADVRLWPRGPGSSALDLPSGTECIPSLEDLERPVVLLALEGKKTG